MNVTECLKTRKSIRRYKNHQVSHSVIDSVVSLTSYFPSWKNTQIAHYITVEDSSLLNEIEDKYTPDYNSNIIRQEPVLMAVTFDKDRRGYERGGFFVMNHLKRQKAHSGTVSGRQDSGQARTLDRRRHKRGDHRQI
nr:nitroreductase family protein [uncultured Mediterraneibacter sp.]